jgi:hypothetical protein
VQRNRRRNPWIAALSGGVIAGALVLGAASPSAAHDPCDDGSHTEGTPCTVPAPPTTVAPAPPTTAPATVPGKPPTTRPATSPSTTRPTAPTTKKPTEAPAAVKASPRFTG